MSKVTIIAEAGVNHNGDIKLAKKLIDVASDAGADYVKFQSFKAEKLVSRFAEKAEYQKKTTDKNESQFDMIKKLELSNDDHLELIKYCEKKTIGFMSSPFDVDGIDYLNSLDVDFFKVPSGELTNLLYLRQLAKYEKPVILSTGMATLDEIKDALEVLKNKDVTVLHCNTEYPTPMEDVNLRAMTTIANELGVKTGYSDHSLGIEVPIAAVALGAVIIEKHFTLDKAMIGPDHRASLEPEELKSMIRSIRNIEHALGSGVKTPSHSESKNIKIARKSIVASKDIQAGEILCEDNLTIKRPGTGVNPMEWDKVLGKEATRKFKTDECIKL